MSKKGQKKDKSKRPPTLLEQILGVESAQDFETRKREAHVMTRLSNDIVEILDALVELGVFKSRSEAVAAYVEKSILPHIELYEKIKKQAQQVGTLREAAMDLITETLED